jgi:prepilin-type processing-associated H-X9-DG protein
MSYRVAMSCWHFGIVSRSGMLRPGIEWNRIELNGMGKSLEVTWGFVDGHVEARQGTARQGNKNIEIQCLFLSE